MQANLATSKNTEALQLTASADGLEGLKELAGLINAKLTELMATEHAATSKRSLAASSSSSDDEDYEE
jgi:hypothetical protein